MSNPKIKFKRSSVEGKKPSLSNLELGEVALNTYDGKLFTRQDTSGVGIATTITNLTPWSENFGGNSIFYTNSVGIGTTKPEDASDPNNTSILNVGVVTANFLYGNGSNLVDVNVSSAATIATATITNTIFGSGTAITSVDTNLSSVSTTDNTLASAKAIKTYVDNQITSGDLDIAGDTGTGSVDLNSQSLTIAGTQSEIVTSASGQTITVGLPDNVIVGSALTVTGVLDVNDGLDVYKNSPTFDRVAQFNSNSTTSLIAFGGSNGTGENAPEIGQNNSALVFNTQNETRAFIRADGNFGIGTSSPASLLNLRLDSSTAFDATADGGQRDSTASLLIQNEDGTNESFSQIIFDTAGTNQSIARIAAIRTATSSNDLAFVVEGGNVKREAMRITSNGNVGIGTNSPGAELHIKSEQFSGLNIDTQRTSGNIGGISFQSQGVQKSQIYGTIGEQIYYNASLGHIFNAGNVGVGTATPGYKLDVNGDIKVGELGTLWFSDASGSIEKIVGSLGELNLYADAEIRFYESDTNGESFSIDVNNSRAFFQNDSDTYWYHPAANTHAWTTNNVERFRIGSDGFASFSTDALGNTAGNTQNLLQLYTDNSNASYLKIFEQRDVNGTNWTSAFTRIQKIIDATEMGYIQFNGSDINYGIEFGTNGDEKFAVFNRNNSVDLYYDNAKKFETTSTGVDVTGICTAFVLHGEGGTFNAGNDTATDAGFILEEENTIYTKDGTFLRNLIQKKSDIIIIGQQNTSLIDNIELKPGGAGGKVKLHAGGTSDNVKLSTTSTGVDVTGNITLTGDLDLDDNKKILLGTGNDCEIYHDGSANIIQSTNGSISLQVPEGSEIQLAQGGSFEHGVKFIAGGAVQLYNNNSLKLATTSTGVDVTGLLSATTKSFVIDHPTKEGMKLRYGSLEGPENGVYVRGRLKGNNTIELPDYWTGLVDEETITVNLTPIGRKAPLHSVVDIADNTVVVESANDIVDCYYTVFGERKDVERFEVEF